MSQDASQQPADLGPSGALATWDYSQQQFPGNQQQFYQQFPDQGNSQIPQYFNQTQYPDPNAMWTPQVPQQPSFQAPQRPMPQIPATPVSTRPKPKDTGKDSNNNGASPSPPLHPLAAAGLSPKAIAFLETEGFTLPEHLRDLDQNSVLELLEKDGGKSLPLRQAILIKRLAVPPTPIGPPPPGKATRPAGPPGPSITRPAQTIDQAFSAILQQQQSVPAPGAARRHLPSYQDPSILLQPRGKKSSALEIIDFIPGLVTERERIEVPGTGGKMVLETGPRKPRLKDVTPHQWGIGNARILSRLIADGTLSSSEVPDYLAYTVKVHQLALRFEWESVLMYDKEYRSLQADLDDLPWGADVGHLSTVHLLPKQAAAAVTTRPAQQSAARPKPPRKTGPLDPKSGREICIGYNTGRCSYPGCRYLHVCSTCSADHPASEHPKNQ